MAVKSLVHMMYKAEKPATRLKAARTISRLAKDAIEIEDLAAAVAELKSAGAPVKGHGAKLPRKQSEAIAALLTQPGISEAAGAVGISTPTLYRWMEDARFLVEYAAAVRSVWEPAMSLAQQREGGAVTIIPQVRGGSRRTGIDSRAGRPLHS
jgi:hypothetical protein